MLEAVTSPFHPDLERLARRIPPWLRVGPGLLKVLRPLERFRRRYRPDDVGIEVLDETSVRVHRPPAGVGNGPGPALLWIHGGGYVLGTAGQDDAICRYFARELGALVAAVEYRVAPEHPHPAPVEDCHEALVWLAGRADVDPERVAIGGASAGGGLAASLALLARDRGEVRPAFQLLVYPMVDDRTAARTDLDEQNLRLWNNRSNRFAWEAYTGHPPGSPDVDPLAVPARHPDLTGLPPAWIGVGDLDLFHDEDLAYADRLRAAGVPVEVEVVEGAFHGFDLVAAQAGVSQAFRAAQTRALAAALAPSG